MELVKEIRLKMPRIGTRKLYYLLSPKLRELGVGRDKLFSILRANHMLIVAKKQYHVTTNSHHRFRKHKNLIENLEFSRPEQVWVSDITYIGNRQQPSYLALITDAYSKKIMGYDVSESLNAQGVIRALKMALKTRKYKHLDLIHHSDRGLQYCGYDYQKILHQNRIRCSMTEKYDPYQNAIAERINGIIKHEFINEITLKNIQLMKIFIKETIEIYNNLRPHYSCLMKTPNYMHQQRKIEIKNYKTKNNSKVKLAVI